MLSEINITAIFLAQTLLADASDTLVNGIVGNVVTVIVGMLVSAIVIAVKSQINETIQKALSTFENKQILSREKFKTEVLDHIKRLEERDENYKKEFEKEIEKVHKEIKALKGTFTI